MKYWLVKSEPEVYSIEDLRKEKKTAWTDIRNYQARNYLKEMSLGDLVLFYHSNAEPPGVAGIAKVCKLAYPDPTQFDPKSDYFEPKVSQEAPRWFSPDLQFVEKFRRLISLEELRGQASLSKLPLLQRGSRLSVHPVTQREFECIVALANEEGARKRANAT